MGVVQALIEQSRMPTGRVGRIMLRIMGSAHRSLALRGISKLQPCESVLDVSCGGGDALQLMAKSGRFKRICGIDFSQDAVALAAAKNQRLIESGQVAVLQASVLELPFESGCFDAATTFQSHYHWPDVLSAMREVYRVLKPGGQFVLVAERYKIRYHMTQYNDAEQTRALFEDSGFRDVVAWPEPKHICIMGYK